MYYKNNFTWKKKSLANAVANDESFFLFKITYLLFYDIKRAGYIIKSFLEFSFQITLKDSDDAFKSESLF